MIFKTVHDLRKLHVHIAGSTCFTLVSLLAKRVGSKTFTTLYNRYIRNVLRVKATFQVPLGTIKPKSI